MNVTSPELVAELMAALDRVAATPAINGAVLTSGKAGSFVAGGDIKDFVGAHDRGMSEAEAFEISHRWNVDLRRIERCGKPSPRPSTASRWAAATSSRCAASTACWSTTTRRSSAWSK